MYVASATEDKQKANATEDEPKNEQLCRLSNPARLVFFLDQTDSNSSQNGV